MFMVYYTASYKNLDNHAGLREPCRVCLEYCMLIIVSSTGAYTASDKALRVRMGLAIRETMLIGIT